MLKLPNMKSELPKNIKNSKYETPNVAFSVHWLPLAQDRSPLPATSVRSTEPGLLLCAKNSHATQEDQTIQWLRTPVLLLGRPVCLSLPLSLSQSLAPSLSLSLPLHPALEDITEKNG